MKIQSLRVQAGWKIKYNLFTEVDLSEENIHEFQGSSLLVMHHETANLLIDLSWRPELDVNGRYILVSHKLKSQPHSQALFIFFVPQKIKRACLFPPTPKNIKNNKVDNFSYHNTR
jgi:hypothetical protein